MSWPYAASYAGYYGAPPAQTPPPPPPRPGTWKQYASPEGKPYWSDGATSVWEEPPAYRDAREKAAALIEANRKAKAEPAPAAAPAAPAPEPNIKPLAAPVLDAKQRVAAFKALLGASDVRSTATFPEVAAKLKDEECFLALPKGERKQALAEYKTQRAKLEKEAERKRSREARAGFLRLLAETEDIKATTPWARADELLAATCDERYTSVAQLERKALYCEFAAALAQKHSAERRSTAQQAVETFRKALVALAREHPAASHEDDDAARVIGVFGRTRFNDVEAALRQKFPEACAGLSNQEQRRAYDAFVDNCHATVRRRDESKRRAFVDACLAAILRGLLPRELPFSELDAVINARLQGGAKAVAAMSAAFAAEEAQLPSDGEEDADAPAVETVVARVKEAMAEAAACSQRLGGDCLVRAFARAKDRAYQSFKVDRRQCRDLARRADLKLGAASSFGAWLEQLERADRCSPPRSSDVRHERRAEAWSLQDARRLRRPQLARVFVDLRHETVQEARDAARRRERRERRFRELLEDYLRWPDDRDAAYEALEPSLARHSAYDGVPRERRRALFDDVLRALRDAKKPAKERWTSAAVSEDDRWSPGLGVEHGPEAPPPKKARASED